MAVSMVLCSFMVINTPIVIHQLLEKITRTPGCVVIVVENVKWVVLWYVTSGSIAMLFVKTHPSKISSICHSPSMSTCHLCWLVDKM